jgi:hypothetical protein
VRHPGKEPWFEKDACGPFFVFYCERKRYPDDPDRPLVEWYLCPDDEDKCHERAYAEGRAHTVELAMLQVADAVAAIASSMLAWASNAPIGAELEHEIKKAAEDAKAGDEG